MGQVDKGIPTVGYQPISVFYHDVHVSVQARIYIFRILNKISHIRFGIFAFTSVDKVDRCR